MATIARVGTLYEVGLQELGEAILRESLRDAAMVFLRCVTSAFEAQIIQDSVLFVQGSGIEATITTFGLPFDAETVKGTFTWKLHRLASSSAITPGASSWSDASPVSLPHREFR